MFTVFVTCMSVLWGLYFSKALFEGLIFGGAYIRRGLSAEGNLRFNIDWASLIAGGCQEACRSLADGSARPTEPTYRGF